MQQKIDQLSDKERDWVKSQIEGAGKLVAIFVGDASEGSLTLGNLDKAFAAFLSANEGDPDIINAVINQVGIAFGQMLVDELALKWVIATDQNGADLAVYGLPGKGDVLIYPASLVAKRWERRETQFLEPLYAQIAAQVGQLRAGQSGPASPSSPKGFFKRWFGKS